MKTWLVLDTNYIAWRAFYTTGGLSYLDQPTGTLFGVFGTLLALKEQFETEHVAFTFDHGECLRNQLLPSYKSTRRLKKVDEAKAQAIEDMRSQLDRLRTRYLSLLGYQNVFWKRGYEADDVMAAVVNGLPDGDRAILVSGDEDLYQLLSAQAAVYHPVKKEFVTARSFKAKYGIHPRDWVKVKCLAGCSTDDVPGLPGVGEKTALDYVRGTLQDTTRGKNIFHTVDQWRYTADYLRNEKLVRLPFEGLGTFELLPDPPPHPKAWETLCEQLGFRTLPGLEGRDVERSYRRE